MRATASIWKIFSRAKSTKLINKYPATYGAGKISPHYCLASTVNSWQWVRYLNWSNTYIKSTPCESGTNLKSICYRQCVGMNRCIFFWFSFHSIWCWFIVLAARFASRTLPKINNSFNAIRCFRWQIDSIPNRMIHSTLAHTKSILCVEQSASTQPKSELSTDSTDLIDFDSETRLGFTLQSIVCAHSDLP